MATLETLQRIPLDELHVATKFGASSDALTGKGGGDRNGLGGIIEPSMKPVSTSWFSPSTLRISPPAHSTCTVCPARSVLVASAIIGMCDFVVIFRLLNGPPFSMW